MQLFATRRQCEMIIECLEDGINSMASDDQRECAKLVDRIKEVINRQCKDDTSTYNGGARHEDLS